MDNRCTPAAVFGMVQAIGGDIWMLGQNRMHPLAELSRAFAVNDTNLKDPARPAFHQIIPDQLADLSWIEGVQIQHSIDG